MFFELFCRIWNPYQVKEVNCMCSEALDLRLCVLVAQSCSTLCDLMNCSCQAPLSLEFSRQEYWSGLPFPSPGDLPDQESNPGFPHCRQTQADALTSEPPGSPVYLYLYLYLYVCKYREGEKERIAVMCFFSLLQVINKILDMCSYLKDYYQPKCPTVIFNF